MSRAKAKKPDRVNLLVPFNTDPKKNWFREAFTWDRDDIYEWLEKVSEIDPEKDRFDAGISDDVRKDLRVIYNNMRSLCLPDGENYKVNNENMKPYQHFVRSPNEAWVPNKDRDKNTDAEISKFKLLSWKQSSKSNRPFWNPYDLLGLFLGLLGPAPQGANKNNFFLPLTAVYGKWCSKIAGHDPELRRNQLNSTHGSGHWPYCFACTWYTSEDRRYTYRLGASLAGSSWYDVGTWRTNIARARFDLLRAPLSNYPFLKKDHWGASMSQYMASGSRTDWGNCAEAYPFSQMFFKDKETNSWMCGCALGRNIVYESQYDEFDGGAIWENTFSPCANCTSLLEDAGASRDFFHAKWQQERAPARPKGS